MRNKTSILKIMILDMFMTFHVWQFLQFFTLFVKGIDFSFDFIFISLTVSAVVCCVVHGMQLQFYNLFVSESCQKIVNCRQHADSERYEERARNVTKLCSSQTMAPHRDCIRSVAVDRDFLWIISLHDELLTVLVVVVHLLQFLFYWLPLCSDFYDLIKKKQKEYIFFDFHIFNLCTKLHEFWYRFVLYGGSFQLPLSVFPFTAQRARCCALEKKTLSTVSVIK